MSIHNSVIDLIGKTPMVRLQRIGKDLDVDLVLKCENWNPGGSVKDRPALAMIEQAEREGLLKKGDVIIEPTSGNTGISLAFVGAVKGYKVMIVMPDSMSLERRKLLAALGAEVILTPGHLQMAGAIDEAQNLVKKNKGAFMPHQFSNKANPLSHAQTTAEEIWADTSGEIDIFVAGVGTGGTISGVGKTLKEKKPEIQIVAMEPKDSAVLSGCEAGPHMIQGIGAGFIPDNFDKEVVDDIVTVTNEDAIDMTRRLVKEEGLLCGISTGANVAAAIQLGRRSENIGKQIVTIACDLGERYLSTILYK